MTGDLGWIHEAGYLRVTGRKKDVIIRGGRNIYPARIEAIMLRHDAVGKATAFPICRCAARRTRLPGASDTQWRAGRAGGPSPTSGCVWPVKIRHAGIYPAVASDAANPTSPIRPCVPQFSPSK